MDQRLYIVAYDIADTKRWRRVFKLMKGYGEWVQLSVFQCRLSAKQQAELDEQVEEEANSRAVVEQLEHPLRPARAVWLLGPAHDDGTCGSRGRPTDRDIGARAWGLSGGGRAGRAAGVLRGGHACFHPPRRRPRDRARRASCPAERAR